MTAINIEGKVNPDLANERKKCTFDVEELAKWWWNGAEELKEKRKIGEYINIYIIFALLLVDFFLLIILFDIKLKCKSYNRNI